jgi:hypothetical protein
MNASLNVSETTVAGAAWATSAPACRTPSRIAQVAPTLASLPRQCSFMLSTSHASMSGSIVTGVVERHDARPHAPTAPLYHTTRRERDGVLIMQMQ